MIEAEDLQQQIVMLQIEASTLALKNQKATELVEATIRLYSNRTIISNGELIDWLLDLRDLLKG